MRREIYNFNYLILSNISMKIMLYYMITSYNENKSVYNMYGIMFIILKMSFYPWSYIIERLIVYVSYEILILVSILSKWVLVIWVEKIKYKNEIEGIVIYNILIVGWIVRRIYTLKVIWWYLILLSSCWFMLTVGEEWWKEIRVIYFWSSVIEFNGIYKICKEMDYMIDIRRSREKLILGIILLSMIGLPPLIGFYTKWWIISINTSVIKIIIGLLGTTICSYITIKIITENIGYIEKSRTDIIMVGWYCIIGLEIIYNMIWII